MEKFSTVINQLSKKAKNRVGIAIIKPSPTIVGSLKRANKVAEVVVYGKKIQGFESVPLGEKAVGPRLIQDFKEHKIHQLVRGQIDDLSMVEYAKKLFNIEGHLKRVDIAIVKDTYGREYGLTGCSNPDLQNLEEKIRVANALAYWVKTVIKIKPKIAVMATCRPGSYGKDPTMSQTYDEAEALVKNLRRNGLTAKNIHIEVEKAIEFANLIIPARGTIGNQILRALYFLGKAELLACPTYFPGKLIYEDNFRNEQDWYSHIVFANALANTPHAEL